MFKGDFLQCNVAFWESESTHEIVGRVFSTQPLYYENIKKLNFIIDKTYWNGEKPDFLPSDEWNSRANLYENVCSNIGSGLVLQSTFTKSKTIDVDLRKDSTWLESLQEHQRKFENVFLDSFLFESLLQHDKVSQGLDLSTIFLTEKSLSSSIFLDGYDYSEIVTMPDLSTSKDQDKLEKPFIDKFKLAKIKQDFLAWVRE